jgi:purine-binding chemotaxis protein CheW
MVQLLSEETSEQEGAKYLTFMIGAVCYGLDIRSVTEIIGLQGITPVPDVPVYMRGVINLRGKVIPIMDVRSRFRLEQQEYHDRTCIIVIEVHGSNVGLVVDAVSEVLAIPAQDTEPLPDGFGLGNRFVSGLGKVGQEVKLLLNTGTLVESVAQAGTQQDTGAQAQH